MSITNISKPSKAEAAMNKWIFRPLNFKFMFFILTLLTRCLHASDDCQTKRIDFYEISHYRTKPNSSKIIEESVIVSQRKIISYEDIIDYNPGTYSFTISPKRSEKLRDIKNHRLHGTPFAVMLGDKILYTGYFWASYSSQICDWVVIDPINYKEDNTLTVKLGYPVFNEKDSIPDWRNHPLLIQRLKKDDKLENGGSF